MKIRRVLAVSAVLLASASAFADDYYVSAARGKGKKGTKEEPARDLGIITDKLKPGDVVHIAAGTYYGISETGVDEIKVPVSIIGGYSDDFTKRDPWGEFKTVFAGKNKSDNFKSNARLLVGDRRAKVAGKSEILVDGIIFDNGERNGYVEDAGLKITRRFNPKTKTNIAPDSPGLSIDAPEGCEITVVNCVVMNCAPHHKTGALKVFGGKGTKAAIRNNLVANNTGSGICCLSWHHPKDGKDLPEFVLENNTVLFTWRFDPMSTDCGSALKIESDVRVTARANVFAFSDAYGVDNALKSKLVSLSENLFCASMIAPYLEFSTKMKLEGIEEEAKCVDEAKDNVKEQITVPVPEAWAVNYAARSVIDRQAAESAVEPLDNWQNELRRMLGLPLQGSDLKTDSDVWLHRLDLESGLKCGGTKVNGKYGCERPAAK
ncbi:MAG: hypothetical protein HYY16_13075 [Planctomycetes bacterium]|nr:hypothetical protein [Planctomycetota bacterium]